MDTMPSGQPVDPMQPKPDRTWEILCHLAGLLFYVFPFGNIFGPLFIWLFKKDQSPSVDAHGKEALNFQISMSIYIIIAGLSIFVLIGFLLLPIVLVVHAILIVIAAIKASNGEFYRYPATIRFIH